MYIIKYNWLNKRRIYGQKGSSFVVFYTKRRAEKELKILKESPDLYKNPRIVSLTIVR